ncbi:retinoid-inducible serine carboxypeptidase-like [Styela clava]
MSSKADNENKERDQNDEDSDVKKSGSSKTTLIISGVVAAVAALVLVIVLPIYFTNNDDTIPVTEPNSIITEPHVHSPLDHAMEDIETDSGYVKVRDSAFMYWLFYYQDDNFAPQGMAKLENTPIVMWLQGGPGAASTGYGLFEEIGPLDLNYNRRNASWTGLAHLLFVDQPVGVGYSYVTDNNAYATDFNQAGLDLVTLLHGFYSEKPELQNNPLYIFCQSYGGKFAVAAANHIIKEIEGGTLNINFGGIGLGSAYISPIDSLLSWGDYLHHWSLLDQQGREEVNANALLAKEAIDNGKWLEAYNIKMETQAMAVDLTDNVDVTNILYPHYPPTETDPYNQLMNNEMLGYLGNIPENVEWGSQRSAVEEAMKEDIMKPVVDLVDSLLEEGIHVAVYNGMLDMIVSTPGQEMWLDKLTWSNMHTFNGKRWTPEHYVNGDTGGFSKQVGNFYFWWIIDAGHSIPVDQPDFMLYVLYKILSAV